MDIGNIVKSEKLHRGIENSDMTLSLKQVRYFIATADAGQVSQAAIALNVSQSAVTAAIKQHLQVAEKLEKSIEDLRVKRKETDVLLREQRGFVAVGEEGRWKEVGDALVARSFGLVAGAPRSLTSRSVRILELLSTATGSTSGLVGGQGLEQESAANAHAPEGAQSYHALKTGALFAMAAEAGAVAAGSREAAAWTQVGWLIGRGYQLVHDLGAMPVGRPAGLHDAAELFRAQLAALSAALHERIGKLAAEPEPLLRLLDELSEPLLRRAGREPERAPRREEP